MLLKKLLQTGCVDHTTEAIDMDYGPCVVVLVLDRDKSIYMFRATASDSDGKCS